MIINVLLKGCFVDCMGSKYLPIQSTKVLLDKGIPTERLYGLGTDVTAVMTGNYLKPCEGILTVESLSIVFCI